MFLLLLLSVLHAAYQSIWVSFQLEDFHLDKSADYSDVTCEGRFHQEAALLLLSTWEVSSPVSALWILVNLGHVMIRS